MKTIIFALLSAALVGSINCQWREVDTPRSLTVSGNATGTLQVGDLVELVCTAAGAVLPYSTVVWTSLQGYVQRTSWTRGYSPLPLPLLVTPELHGTQFFCTVPFVESVSEKIYSYNVRSESLQITVAGVGSPQGLAGLYPARPVESLTMESLTGTSHRVGDAVAFYCTTYDLMYSVVDVIQAKGNYEIQLHSGLQPWREVRFQVSAADDGSEVYCRVTASDPSDYRVHYTLVSNRVPLHVSP